MKLSKETFAVLKNFSSIYDALYIDEQKSIRTVSIDGAIIGCFDCQESFDIEFAIFDFVDMLSIIGLYKLDDVDLVFHDTYLEIKNGTSTSKMVYIEPSLIIGIDKIKPSEKYKKFSDFDATFELSPDNISELKKISNIMKVSDMQIEMIDGKGTIKLSDSEDPDSHAFEKDIEGEGSCNISVIVESINLIGGQYTVSVKSDIMTKFQHSEIPLMYFISQAKD